MCQTTIVNSLLDPLAGRSVDPAEAFVFTTIQDRCRTPDEDRFVAAMEALVVWTYRRDITPPVAAEILRAAEATPHAAAVRRLLQG